MVRLAPGQWQVLRARKASPQRQPAPRPRCRESVQAVLAGVENPHGLEELSIGALYLFQVRQGRLPGAAIGIALPAQRGTSYLCEHPHPNTPTPPSAPPPACCCTARASRPAYLGSLRSMLCIASTNLGPLLDFCAPLPAGVGPASRGGG